MNKWTKKKFFVLVGILLLIWALAAASEHKGKPSPPQAPAAAPASSIALVPYKQEDFKNTSTARRKRGQIGIYLADPAAQVSQEALAATCMAAAKHYAAAYGLQALSVFLSDMPGGQPWEGTRLAQCSYSPDRGGWSGDQGWLWERVQAAPRGLTGQERQMKKLWGELRNSYQKNGSTDEAALSVEIAKRMQIKPEEVSLLWFMMDDVDPAPYAGVEPQGAVK